jgi:hypothetical protein
MSDETKETSQGELAVNAMDCRAVIDKGEAGGKLRL